MKKIALFAFNGDPMCFIHVLLNSIDMREKGFNVALVIEGSATALIKEMDKEGHKLYDLYQRVKESGIIDCVCRACSLQMNSVESAEQQKLPLCAEMHGHPSMASYIDEGYEVISF
jgi:hypothetical protein